MHIRNRMNTWAQKMSSYMLSVVMIFPCLPVSPGLLSATAIRDVAPSHNKVVMAYAFDAKSPAFADRDAKYLTHINWSFALIENGRVSGEHWRNIDTLLAYKRKYPHIKLILSIGGWGADGFSQASASAEGRETLATSAIELMRRYDFEGIDLDWEYPGISAAGIASSPDDKKNFTLLLSLIRKKLDAVTAQDGRYRLLTIACGASQDCAQGIDAPAVAQYVDYVHIMTYDMRGGSRQTAHHTNLYPTASEAGGSSAHTALLAFEKEGIPRKKLIIGAAFYGHMWKNVQSGDDRGFLQSAGDQGNTTINYQSITSNYLNQNGYVRYWDEAARAPFLFNGTNFISYDDAESVYEKASYVIERGLAGVMYWEYSQDPSGVLLEAIDRGLRGVK